MKRGLANDRQAHDRRPSQATSGPKPDLPATQRSRAGESSTAPGPGEGSTHTFTSSRPTALDATAQAPLPRGRSLKAASLSDGHGHDVARVVIAEEPRRESGGSLARAFVRVLERKYPGSTWHVDWVKAGRAAEASPGESARSAAGREDCEHRTIRIAA